ncbi:MAG TPA: hypothetical protein IAA00_04805, partial [Candidatus Blautia ornithocaccae]|nr:hypothetical protein [Candidatus Blautia ornithocaccae]
YHNVGLKLSDEKTVITNINNGFDFLGWNFRKFKEKLLIQPSRKSKQKVTKSLSRTVKYYHEASQETLIIKLNQITCYPAFYLVLNHATFKQIKKRHNINYSDGFYIGLLYAVPLVLS